MDYLNKIPSLEEMSLAHVAFNLCQENGFKETALLLEKPTYGICLRYNIFVSDPEKLAIWANLKKDYRSFLDFEMSCCVRNSEKVDLWDAAIEMQFQRLVKGIPSSLRQRVHNWIIRIALEYLSYSRRQEALFGVSRYLLMDVLTCDVWTKAGRLDENKLAHLFLQDERLTILQRYRIACAYCLHTHILQLRLRLSQEEKQLTSGEGEDGIFKESHDLVLLWSRYIDREEEGKVNSQTNHLWTDAIRKATYYGNRMALMLCWERLKNQTRQLIVFEMALISLQIRRKMYEYGTDNKSRLISNRSHFNQHDTKIVEHFNLPFYHSELMCFFLSQMDKEQQLLFFKKAFLSGYTDRIIECFLDWPHQDDFLPTINLLWGVIPKDKYGQCLLTLVNKYSGKKSCYYDYQSLLEKLWEKTPNEYKQYVLSDNECDNARYIGYALLTRLLDRSPFQEEDEALFKLIFQDLPLEERRYLINPHSQIGENICSLLTQKEKWSFVNWLLKACLPKKEISSFKKELIQSDVGFKLCVDELKQNHESLVEDLIDWCFDLNTDKDHYKYALRKLCPDECKPQMSICQTATVRCMISFSTLWDWVKKRYRSAFERTVSREQNSSLTRKSDKRFTSILVTKFSSMP